MKLFVTFVLFMTLGFILVAGCVAMTDQSTVNTSTATGFTPFSNTSDPGLNKTINATTNDLRVERITQSVHQRDFISCKPIGRSWQGDCRYGETHPTPVPNDFRKDDLSRFAWGSICEQETVTTRFGSYATVDFSERLLKRCGIPRPERPTDCANPGILQER